MTTLRDSANNPTLNTTIYILSAGYVDTVRCEAVIQMTHRTCSSSPIVSVEAIDDSRLKLP